MSRHVAQNESIPPEFPEAILYSGESNYWDLATTLSNYKSGVKSVEKTHENET